MAQQATTVEATTEQDVRDFVEGEDAILRMATPPMYQDIYFWSDEDGYHQTSEHGEEVPHDPEDEFRKDGAAQEFDIVDELPDDLR